MDLRLSESAVNFNKLFLGTISSFKLDVANGVLLMEDQAAQVKLLDNVRVSYEDFLVALIIVYNYRSQPQFSLDPSDPSNVDGPFLKKLYNPDVLLGTDFGETLFVTDYLMKCFGFGISVDDQLKGSYKKIGRVLSQLHTQEEIYFEKSKGGSERKQQRARLWIEIGKVDVFNRSNTLEFGEVQMVVNSRMQKLDPTSKTGLVDLEDEDPNSDFRIYADNFTKCYDKIAEIEPQFARLKELAKLLVIVKYLYDQRVDIDIGFIEENLHTILQSKPTFLKHQQQIATLKVQYERKTTQHVMSMQLIGGVSLLLENKVNFHADTQNQTKQIQQPIGSQPQKTPSALEKVKPEAYKQ